MKDSVKAETAGVKTVVKNSLTAKRKKFELNSLFPGSGDPRQPPAWFSRALLYTALAVAIFSFVSSVWHQLDDIIAIVIVSFFFALALEPVVLWAASKGVNKRLATFLSMLVIIGIIVGAMVLFGNLFITQLTALLTGVPKAYADLKTWASSSFGVVLPESGELLAKFIGEWGKDIGEQAVLASTSLIGALLGLMGIVLMVYYLCADGDKFRRSIVSWFKPQQQGWILKLLDLIQKNVASFLGSRIILAVLSTLFTAIFLLVIGVPYWLPLALFMGIVSQFVPTVGTYIGGALPVVVALANNGIWVALGVLAFLTVYQQIENFIFSPKISADALDLNPAIAFLSVLAFGSVFGALGAFLALPATATIVSIFKAVTQRYEPEAC